MLHEVSGDILLSKAETIALGVAANDHFDSGLALALRERWPAMFKAFRHRCHVEHRKAGQAWSWSDSGRRIVAWLTQGEAPMRGGHPGRASAPHVDHALRTPQGLVSKERVKSLALPRIATGVGGRDWSEVEPLVRQHLGGLDIPIYVDVAFHAGRQAREPGL